MKRIKIFGLAWLITASSFGQMLSVSQKKQILKELSTVIERNYVLQDSVGIIAERLSEIQKSNALKESQTPNQFATYLTDLLRTTTRDAHFAILYNAEMHAMATALQQTGPGGSTPNMSFGGEDVNDIRKNYFFTKVEVMEGNIGYLKLEQIPSLESSKSTLDAAMAFLKNTDALMIDLRANPGGVGGFIPYLISYFFPSEKQLLYSRDFMAWDSTSYHYTHENIGSDRYLNKPVYLLIDQFTGSAATNMAYTMSAFGLATLVGENTGSGYRGAHSATIYPLPEGFVSLVPIGRVVNAKTKTNWRTNGVDPDVPCTSEYALETAHRHVLERLLDESSDPELSLDINKTLAKLKEKERVVKTPLEDLSEYAGRYESTTITWENGKLYTKRSTTPVKLEIRRKEGDLFKIILPPNARGNLPDLRFNRDNGVIRSLTTLRDGIEERTEKKEVK